MKKLGVCLLSLCMGITCALVNVKAKTLDNIEMEETSIVKDEYTMLLEEIETYEKEGKSVLTMNKAESEYYLEIKKAVEEYPGFIYQQQKLPDEELKKLHYDDQQIAAIRAFNGEESLIPLAAAYVTASLTATEFYYNQNENRTYFAINLLGNWSGSPLIRSQDTVGLGVGGTTSNYIEISSTGRVTFDNGTTITNLSSKGHTNGRQYKFGLTNGNSQLRYFQFTFKGFGDGKMTGSAYSAAYAHAKLTTNLGFGLDFNGKAVSGYGISIDVKSTFEEMYYDFKTISSYL